jgi:hypothetical protein
MNITTPHYIAWADFRDLGLGNICDPTLVFDDAVSHYADARADGRDAIVLRVLPGKGAQAGFAEDVTEDADQRIAKLCRLRKQDLPDWLTGESDETRAYEAALDDAHERAERARIHAI